MKTTRYKKMEAFKISFSMAKIIFELVLLYASI